MAGESTKDINFETEDDNIDELDGSFTISLTNGTEYTLGTEISKTVNVLDNDVPVISIADATPVVEGVDSYAEFVLTASIDPINDLDINFNIGGDTQFMPFNFQTPRRLSFASNSATGEYTTALDITIEDDHP